MIWCVSSGPSGRKAKLREAGARKRKEKPLRAVVSNLGARGNHGGFYALERGWHGGVCFWESHFMLLMENPFGGGVSRGEKSAWTKTAVVLRRGHKRLQRDDGGGDGGQLGRGMGRRGERDRGLSEMNSWSWRSS